MSDIRKWMQLLSEDSIEKGSAVKLSDDWGGGIGTFEQLSEDNPEIAIINIKGTPQEIPLTSLQKVLDQDHAYGEDPCYNITPDLFEPGASVRIKNLYGGGTGDGYGVFVAYSTDGQQAIVTVDSEERVVPVDLVYPADEQEAKDNFASVGSDGSESPFTSAGDNVQDKGQSKMSDMERWIDAVSNPKQEESVEPQLEASEDCGCGDYECTTCFPLSEDEINYHADVVEDAVQEEEDLVELDLDNSEYYNDEDEADEDEPEPRVGDDEMVDVGDDEMSGPDDVYSDDMPSDDVAMGGASEDVSELLGKIEYVQNMGMSMSDRHYDVDQLMKMKPDVIKRIYAKVMGDDIGESIEEDLFGEAIGGSSDEPGDSLLLGNPDEGNTYSMVSPGDHIIFRGQNAVFKGYHPKSDDYVILNVNGKDGQFYTNDVVMKAVPAELVETSAGSVAVAAGLGKVLDQMGIYEAASIDPAEVKSLERMDVESAKQKAAELIQNSRTSDARKSKLIGNVGKAKNVVQVLQLMYNLLLAGDGHATIGSKWQDKYNEAVDPHDDQTMDMFDDECEEQCDPELKRMRSLAGLGGGDGYGDGGE